MYFEFSNLAEFENVVRGISGHLILDAFTNDIGLLGSLETLPVDWDLPRAQGGLDDYALDRFENDLHLHPDKPLGFSTSKHLHEIIFIPDSIHLRQPDEFDFDGWREQGLSYNTTVHILNDLNLAKEYGVPPIEYTLSFVVYYVKNIDEIWYMTYKLSVLECVLINRPRNREYQLYYTPPIPLVQWDVARINKRVIENPYKALARLEDLGDSSFPHPGSITRNRTLVDFLMHDVINHLNSSASLNIINNVTNINEPFIIPSHRITAKNMYIFDMALPRTLNYPASFLENIAP